MTIDWSGYDNSKHYDELIASSATPRVAGRRLIDYLGTLSSDELWERRYAAELAIKTMGVSFTVYSEAGNIDRAWPFDIVPRTLSGSEWRRLEAGLIQRLTALNMFINDLYGKQKVIADKVFPAEILAQSANFRRECIGMQPAFGVWAHICGSDLVRDHDGTVYVLEDNLRVPSGVAYMLENRAVTKRVLPELFEDQAILPVSDYSTQLYNRLASLSPRPLDDPEIVLLTPVIFNSAYFEHAYLAQQMGVELVEGADLVVGDDDCVYMRTIDGLSRVDVIYRRIDDLFLDPEAFRPDSMLGVPGLMRAWRKGNVALANAPGAGVADDKVVYAYVPALIKYYLDQDPIIPNVPTYRCMDPKEREHVIANLANLVVKPANESGGYGLLIGPAASAEERDRYADRIRQDPRNFVAQPVLSLSTVPTLCDGQSLEPRHVDLRPFILQTEDSYVTPGGLTRVALVKNSLVVNSSQGGGSKDTWVVLDEED